MKNMTDDLFENQKYLDQLLVDIWENDFSTCEEMNNLKMSIKTGDIIGIKDNIKEFVLTAFKLGYNKGFDDGKKPQEDVLNAKLKENSDKTLALMEELMNKLNKK